MATASQPDLLPQAATGFAANGRVVIDPMMEVAEISRVKSIASQTLTLASNLSFAHTEGALVLRLAGNQFKLYRAANVGGTGLSLDALSSYARSTLTNPDQGHSAPGPPGTTSARPTSRHEGNRLQLSNDIGDRREGNIDDRTTCRLPDGGA